MRISLAGLLKQRQRVVYSKPQEPAVKGAIRLEYGPSLRGEGPAVVHHLMCSRWIAQEPISHEVERVPCAGKLGFECGTA
jgi:hypothetical protein